MIDRPAMAGPDPAEPLPGDDSDLERSIARLLTVGTYASIALLAVGLVLLLASGLGPRSADPGFDLGRIPADLLALHPAGFIVLGLLVVVATPAARVAASFIGYVRRGEREMALIAALILVVIGASLAVGLALEA